MVADKSWKRNGQKGFHKTPFGGVGGIILTGCGSDNGTGRFPNGYRYYRVKNLNDQVDPQGSAFPIQEFGDGTIRSSGIFYCASIQDGSLLAALNHLPTAGHRGSPRDSLLYIPGAGKRSHNRIMGTQPT